MRYGSSVTFEWLGLILGLAVLLWRVSASLRVARDARSRGWSRPASTGWAISALVYSPWYWWRARLPRLKPAEAMTILAQQSQAHRLALVVNLRCPLCDAEMTNVLTTTRAGALAVRSPAKCPRCDFRLDACRHCRHFSPAEEGWGGQKDFSTGRCRLYRGPQPVRQAYPRLASRLEAMGYETLSAPKMIVDSYVPLDECKGFAPEPARLRLSKIAWLNRERAALIQLHHKHFQPTR